MTIPTRQAPPPPVNSQLNRNFALSASAAQGTQRNRSTTNTLRYTPTTDWDDKPFPNDPFEPWGSSVRQAPAPPVPQTRHKKLPPPRPPPPRVGSNNKGPAPKKPSTLHSNTILANLLSRARLTSKAAATKVPSSTATTVTNGNAQRMPPPAVPPQPNQQISWTANFKTSSSFSSTTSSSAKELISFDSPPSSPTFTQKSNSDCVSVDSFSSDSNYSPNNGFSSQAESGFEDDFALDSFKTPSQPRSTRSTPIDPFDLLEDPFTTLAPSSRPPAQTSHYNKPTIAQKPMVNVVGNASFFAFSGMNQSNSASSLSSMNSNRPGVVQHDTLCNGKNLIEPPPSRALPTIIRPTMAAKPRISPTHTMAPKPPVPVVESSSSDDSSLDDSIVSPPMPSIPPPAPPKEYFEAAVEATDTFAVDDEEKESYGIALYDFGGEQDDDLPFRAGDKIYLLRQLNDQWYFGRDKRGCEGMFPMNYIDVKIHLLDSGVGSCASGSSTPSIDKPIQVRALYDFHAETSEDLELKVSTR